MVGGTFEQLAIKRNVSHRLPEATQLKNKSGVLDGTDAASSHSSRKGAADLNVPDFSASKATTGSNNLIHLGGTILCQKQLR